MNSTIADSIIIKVGHGIMTIPRNSKDFGVGSKAEIRQPR